MKILLEIKDLVDKELGLDISRNTRKQDYVFARVIYYKLARDYTSYSLSTIGSLLGKDHATVLHGVRLFESFNQVPNAYRKQLEAFEKINSKLDTMDLKNEESIVTRLLREKNDIIERLSEQNNKYNELRDKHNTMLKYFKKYEKNVYDKYAEV
jgi:hypothetical protein